MLIFDNIVYYLVNSSNNNSLKTICDMLSCRIHGVFSFVVVSDRAAEAPLRVPVYQDAAALSALQPRQTTHSPPFCVFCPSSFAGSSISGAAV